MNKHEQAEARALHMIVTKEQPKDLDKYLYASITDDPIKIISTNGSDDALDYTVECPNCKTHTLYGTGLFMDTGMHYCEHHNCHEQVIQKLKDERGY